MSEQTVLEIEPATARKPRKPAATAVAKVEAVKAPAVSTTGNDVSAMMALVERIITDPNVTPERVSQAFDLYERVKNSAARQAYYAAFAEMQPKLPVIAKKGSLKTNEKDEKGIKTGKQIEQSKYAKWEDIVEGITEPLSAFGFALSFKIDQPTEARVAVTCTLSHRDGHHESTSFALPIDTSGSKNNVQGWASSVSYAKRYTACALLNIVGRDEDDDGRAAGQKEEDGPISDEQLAELIALADEVGADKAKFCRYAKVDSFADIQKSQFEKVKSALNAKRGRAE